MTLPFVIRRIGADEVDAVLEPLAEVLVHRRARRAGLARAMLAEAERAAREAGKTVLVLDTVSGGDAERLYGRCGWQRVGEIPNYALMPDGRLCATTYFHRQL